LGLLQVLDRIPFVRVAPDVLDGIPYVEVEVPSDLNTFNTAWVLSIMGGIDGIFWEGWGLRTEGFRVRHLLIVDSSRWSALAM